MTDHACACVHVDDTMCIVIRYPWVDSDAMPERCECCCHHDFRLDADELEDDGPGRIQSVPPPRAA